MVEAILARPASVPSYHAHPGMICVRREVVGRHQATGDSGERLAAADAATLARLRKAICRNLSKFSYRGMVDSGGCR